MADILGKVSIWLNDTDNEKAPQWKGKIQDENRNVIAEISLWRNNSENEKAPLIVGKILEPYKKEGATKGKADSSSVF